MLDNYFEFAKKHGRKIIEDEFYSHFEDYGDINQDEKGKYVNDKLSKLTIHTKFKKTRSL